MGEQTILAYPMANYPEQRAHQIQHVYRDANTRQRQHSAEQAVFLRVRPQTR